MKISVIIPLYNTETYLRRCAESLINSKVSSNDIEFIFVDDGSTDNSIQILKSYNDPRIKIIQKNHSNVYETWKLGLEHSNGEYIMNVDSDDYIESTLFEDIINIVKNQKQDLIMFNYKKCITKNGKDKIGNKMMHLNEGLYLRGTKDFSNIITPDLEHPSCLFAKWNKVFKREMLLSIINNAKCINDFCNKTLEDMKIIMLMFSKINSLYFIDKSYYYYRVRSGSITHEKNRMKIEFDETKNLIKILNENKEKFNISDNYFNNIYLYRHALVYLKSVKFKNFDIANSIYNDSKYKKLIKMYIFKNKLLGFLMKNNLKVILGVILNVFQH